jgi:hypothetical protein
MSTLLGFQTPARLLFAFSLLLGAVALSAQPPTNPTAPRPTASAMKTFVLIFRQDPTRERTPAQNQQLAAEMPPWVQRQKLDRRKFDPRILAREANYAGAENGSLRPPDAWPLTALLFIEAGDLADATRVAESHPALKFGAGVEVRAWAAPVPPAPAARRP